MLTILIIWAAVNAADQFQPGPEAQQIRIPASKTTCEAVAQAIADLKINNLNAKCIR